MYLRTLHSKLLTAILIITLTSLSILGYISYNDQKDILSNHIKSNLHFASQSISGEINEFIYERVSDIDLLKRNPKLMNVNAEPEEVQEQFFHFIESHDKYFFGSILLNKDGEVIADMGDGMIGRDLSSRLWFSKANENGLYFSDIYMSPVINRPLVVLAASVENEKGERIGTVSTSLDLDSFWELIDRFSKGSSSANEHQLAFLINHKGEIIAHPDRSKIFNSNFFVNNGVDRTKFSEALQTNKILVNKSGNTSYIFSKITQVSGFNNDWYVVISSPTKILNEPLRNLLVKYIIIFLMVLISSIIISIWLTKYLTRPIYELVQRVSLFGKGQKPETSVIVDYKEVEQLSNSFNLMMQQIIKRENEHRKASTILETTDYGVLSINIRTNEVTTFNSYCEKIFTISKNDVIGNSIEELKLHKTKLKRFTNSLDLEAFNRNNRTHEKKEFSVELGERFHTFSATISRIRSSNDVAKIDDILIMFTDITEQKLLQKEIVHSEKLNAIGQMAAGIAHEIRNPLTTIKGLLELEKENSTDITKYQPIILKEIERINAILNSMLTISKPKTSNKKASVDLNHILDETLLLFVNSFKSNNITVIKRFTNLPKITVNDDYLRQVFFNMFQNACEAMVDGGSITITTNYTENEFFISISDTGVGMRTETVNHLATPFFTTKEQGNGLGLMICYRIIQDLGGSIDVQSELNKGTEFTITIPR